jgi:hypothetical protein
MKKILFVLLFSTLLVNSQNIDPVIDTVEFRYCEFGDDNFYISFNSLSLYNENNEPLTFNFDSYSISPNINKEIYLAIEMGEVIVGEKYIITFYLKKHRVFEGGLDCGEWKIMLINYLLDIRKL